MGISKTHPEESPCVDSLTVTPRAPSMPGDLSFVSCAFTSFWNSCCHLCLMISSILWIQYFSLPHILLFQTVSMQSSSCLFGKYLWNVHSGPGTVLSAGDTERRKLEFVLFSRSFWSSRFTGKGKQLCKYMWSWLCMYNSSVLMHNPGGMKCSIIESDLLLAHCEAVLLYPDIQTLTL